MKTRDAAGVILGMMSEEDEQITPEMNSENMQNALENWHLGPEKASEQPDANSEFWQSFAEVMEVDEEEARRMFCANCEYFDNSPEMLEEMDVVPFNEFDADGGGRGWCRKLDFICHNLRVCQGWEHK